VESYKNRTIKAIKILIKRYKNPIHKNGKLKGMFSHRTCPLCKIYKWKDNREPCSGCIMADVYADGCEETYSYIEAEEAKFNYIHRESKNIEPIKNRAIYLEKVLDVIVNISEEMFEPDNWEYFDQSIIEEEV